MLATSLGRLLFPGCVKGFVFLCTKQKAARSSGLHTEHCHPGVLAASQPGGAEAHLAVALALQRNWPLDHFPWATNRDSIRWYQLSLWSLVRMVNKNHSPGGGKTSCASVEELLLNSL